MPGTGTIANQNKKYRSFEEARSFVHSLRLKNVKEWRNFYKSDKRPSDIPTNSRSTYNKLWKGWNDWLGTEEQFE